MQAEKLAKYLTDLKNKTGLSYEAISAISDRPESTVKNLCAGKVEDPRLDTVAPIVYALGGSIDEMLNPGMNKDEIKETSVEALKDSYNFDSSLLKESYDEQINSIRSHYEQHHNDLKENFEKRLADKREIIESYKEHNKSLEKESRSHKIAFWICAVVLIAILIAEIMNPNLGWIQF